MGKNVKVSIILPVYNVEQYLRQCLDSIVQQTLNDIEIICVDDCSTDGTIKILEEYAAKDDRFIVIKQEKNQGQGVSRNVGIKHANGEYVGFVDPDDWIDTIMYEKMYDDAISHNSDITICDFIRYFEDVNKYGKSKFLRRIEDNYNIVYINCSKNEVLDKQFYNDTLLVLPMACWHKIYKNDFLKKYNIHFPSYRYLEDVMFNFNAFLNANRISYLEDEFYSYRVRKNSAMRANANLTNQSFEVFDDIYNALNKENKYREFEHNFKFFIIFTLRRVCRNLNFIQKLRAYNLSKKYLDKHALKVLKKDLDLDLLKHIFSVGNIEKGRNKYKMIRLFGIKIKFRKRNKQNEKEYYA